MTVAFTVEPILIVMETASQLSTRKASIEFFDVRSIQRAMLPQPLP
jgi:hypothetical protein